MILKTLRSFQGHTMAPKIIKKCKVGDQREVCSSVEPPPHTLMELEDLLTIYQVRELLVTQLVLKAILSGKVESMPLLHSLFSANSLIMILI